MKTNYFTLTLITFCLLGIFSCSEEPSEPKDDQKTLPAYYFKCTIDGVEFNPEMKFAFRNPNKEPRNMVLTGSNGVGSTMLQFVISDSTVELEPGLKVLCTKNSFPIDYSSYAVNDSTYYLTAYKDDGMIVYISEISYEPEGDVKGTFSGTLSDGNGNEKVVTDGSFKLKFQN